MSGQTSNVEWLFHGTRLSRHRVCEDQFVSPGLPSLEYQPYKEGGAFNGVSIFYVVETNYCSALGLQLDTVVWRPCALVH